MSNAYKRFPHTLSATVPQVVLTVPAATTAIVKSIWIANNDTLDADITLTFSPSGVGTHFLVPLKTITTKEYIDILSQTGSGPLILEAADELTITSSNSDVYVVASALLVDRN